MKVACGGALLELVEGDITRQQVDAVVNAANTTLLGGGGVDGAIHRAGGPSILSACRTIGGCPTGEAVATTAGNLPARLVIHTVGPVWHDGSRGEPELLRKAYKNSLIEADRHRVSSIAFPSISTGAYRFPVYRAAPIALSTVIEHLEETTTTIKAVRFVLFDSASLEVYRIALQECTAGDTGKREV